MPPKKAPTAAKKAAAGPVHTSYRDMIKEAILSLKERNGSSRQSIKKYVLANNKLAPASQNAFDSQFNKAIKSGVEKGDFMQPKGTSGPVKLAKKETPAKPAAKKPAAAIKAPAPKKATTKKADKTEKPKTKKTTAGVKKPVGRPKANTAKPRKTSTAAPAVVDKPKVVSVTKSGRKTTTTAKPAEKATKRTTKSKKA
ncbi:histone H1/H5 family protein [Aspergillus mulundensis]|uniref:Histone H1 n=1 Tax=Aspergillus mulundensis TaxID=1810919 RepID=A0A3D8SIL6_9EURO|nr:Histone H1 [Aspergillus mulundensis]RDW86133.1 Histone H1 [Aspergillus mulundensis]